jgi:hypothetical protein
LPAFAVDAEAVLGTDRPDDFFALDDALTTLAERAPRKAKVVELRFFGGLSVDETAEVLHVSPITVMRPIANVPTHSANGPPARRDFEASTPSDAVAGTSGLPDTSRRACARDGGQA